VSGRDRIAGRPTGFGAISEKRSEVGTVTATDSIHKWALATKNDDWHRLVRSAINHHT
jgi:hypothetical protein